jgi:Domain of unknown function (DUF4440)
LLSHDLDTARKLHSDDFELINPLGETSSKEAYIDSGTAFEYKVWKPISPIRVRVHGDSAVIRYESEIELHGMRGHYCHTDSTRSATGSGRSSGHRPPAHPDDQKGAAVAPHLTSRGSLGPWPTPRISR